ncbi:MAG: cell division topological specificity factor MinE [Firmicutes bacterium]|nr:cell division topological specificity factor MinE [Bacillota bacterium]
MGLFNRGANSRNIAKERLKLVLIHDRANVSPQLLEMLKSEIMKVISNYMDIQNDELDIQLTRTKSDEGDRTIPALVANIPIKNVKAVGK